MRDDMEDTIDAMGSSLVKSMGVAYAVSADKAAGVDINQVQKDYLWMSGLKMVGMALLMGVVTVLVGFFASRVGAGVGRDLRDKVFKRVVRFSNAEMDRFSTASLITRSTNDIQQIQMVSTMLLRIVAYGTDPWYRRRAEGHKDGSRNGLGDCTGDYCDPWICNGTGIRSYAEI